MFADNTLTPKEAIRLCALGTLAHSGSIAYSDLAGSVRHFISRISGPSLDLMGTSIELLRYEGLVTAISGTGMEDDAELAISEQGREEFRTLMTAPIRATSSDLNNLIVTLKFRFLELLARDDQVTQLDLLEDVWETEIGRLLDLRAHHADDAGHLVTWLDYDIESLDNRLTWLKKFRETLQSLP